MDLIGGLTLGSGYFALVGIAGFIIVFLLLWLIGRQAYKNEI